MDDLFISVGTFFWGIIRRFYCWAPTFLLDPADYQERYVEPRLGWSIDLPSEAFPIALIVGLTWAAILTYHETRRKTSKPDVIFEVRESIFSLSNYNHNRSEQPFDMAEVTLKGRLRNRGDVGTDIESVRVALMERGWLWIWRKVDEKAPTMLLNRLRANIDLYHHGVPVDAQSSPKDITGIAEMWVYLSIPVSLKPESRRPHRLRTLIDAYGQRHPSPTYEPVDLPAAFRIGRASFERIHKVLGKPSESTQNTEGSQPPTA